MKRSNLGRNAAKWLGCGVLAIAAAACASNTPPAQQPVAMGEMTEPGPQSPQGPLGRRHTRSPSPKTFRRECQLPNARKTRRISTSGRHAARARREHFGRRGQVLERGRAEGPCDDHHRPHRRARVSGLQQATVRQPRRSRAQLFGPGAGSPQRTSA